MRYVSLDALRGSAALAVLFYHLFPHGSAGFGSPWRFASGYLAVDLFFILSGFVIAHAYEGRLRGDLTTGKFMVSRFVRLQPMIAVGTLAGFGLAVWQRVTLQEGAPGYFEIATALPANLLMLPNILLPWGIFLLNPPAWSLFYELVANAVYAVCLRPGARRLQRRYFAIPLAGFVFVGLSGLIVATLWAGDLDRGVVLQDWPVALARIGFCFPLGILLQRTRKSWMPLIPVVPLSVLLAASLIFLSVDVFGPGRSAYDLCFVVVIAPAMVMLGTVTAPGRRLAPWAEWLGLISYPLYALQAPIKHAIEAFLPLTGNALLGVTAASAIAGAWMLARLEPYLRRALDHLLKSCARSLVALQSARQNSPAGSV